MKTILRILERAGGYRPTLYLKIENPPFMALVIEATPEPGPSGLHAISIAHYGEQNGDLMRDPEMCFVLSKPPLCGLSLSSFYFRNDYLGVEQYSRCRDGENYVSVPDLHRQHETFARQWDRNLCSQGFLEAFSDKSILRVVSFWHPLVEVIMRRPVKLFETISMVAGLLVIILLPLLMYFMYRRDILLFDVYQTGFTTFQQDAHLDQVTRLIEWAGGLFALASASSWLLYFVPADRISAKHGFAMFGVIGWIPGLVIYCVIAMFVEPRTETGKGIDGLFDAKLQHAMAHGFGDTVLNDVGTILNTSIHQSHPRLMPRKDIAIVFARGFNDNANRSVSFRGDFKLFNNWSQFYFSKEDQE